MRFGPPIWNSYRFGASVVYEDERFNIALIGVGGWRLGRFKIYPGFRVGSSIDFQDMYLSFFGGLRYYLFEGLEMDIQVGISQTDLENNFFSYLSGGIHFLW
jgi:hypothetical protein